MKLLELEYERRRQAMMQHHESIMQTRHVNLNEIPLPELAMPAAAPAEAAAAAAPRGILKRAAAAERRAPAPPPGPPPPLDEFERDADAAAAEDARPRRIRFDAGVDRPG